MIEERDLKNSQSLSREGKRGAQMNTVNLIASLHYEATARWEDERDARLALHQPFF